ncbi:hypothetical protein FM107_09870 [Sphingobacterium sp. JB170]|nr:hypothetical protein FM107_09870 [Sphingobacterium sp. JB170]
MIYIMNGPYQDKLARSFLCLFEAAILCDDNSSIIPHEIIPSPHKKRLDPR